MPYYTPRPIPVFAMQWDGSASTARKIEQQFNGACRQPHYSFTKGGLDESGIYRTKKHNKIFSPKDTLFEKFHGYNHTKNTFMYMKKGDYIIRDHSGDISVMRKEEFEERYYVT